MEIDPSVVHIVEKIRSRRLALDDAWRLVLGLAAAKLLLHLVTARNYGFFVDELYFMAAGEHLAWGYVDMAPGAAVLAWLARAIFPDTVAGIHLLPALAGAGLVLVTGALVQALGGRWFAQLLAGLSVLIAGVYLVAYSYLSMNALEPLIWMGCAWMLIRLIQTGNPRWWLGFGVLAGLGLMNKHTMLLFGFALVAGVLLTPARRHLWTRWFWLGGAAALLIFLPNLVWNIQQGFPILELQANIRASQRNVQLNPLQFVLEEIVYLHPFTLPIWLAGLGWFFFHPRGKPYRALGWAFLISLVALIALQGRTYYLAPAFPMLLAGGAVALENWLEDPRRNWLRVMIPVALMYGGGVVMPFFLPILPPEQYITFAETLRMRPPRLENFQESALPQLFADRFGWPEMAAATAEVFHSLPPEEQANTVIFGGNYGIAGAIDFYGPALNLPKAISGHQNYYLWGPGERSGETMIALGMQPSQLWPYYEHVEIVGEVGHTYAMGYQRFPIFLCRGLKQPLPEIWEQFKNWN